MIVMKVRKRKNPKMSERTKDSLTQPSEQCGGTASEPSKGDSDNGNKSRKRRAPYLSSSSEDDAPKMKREKRIPVDPLTRTWFSSGNETRRNNHSQLHPGLRDAVESINMTGPARSLEGSAAVSDQSKRRQTQQRRKATIPRKLRRTPATTDEQDLKSGSKSKSKSGSDSRQMNENKRSRTSRTRRGPKKSMVANNERLNVAKSLTSSTKTCDSISNDNLAGVGDPFIGPDGREHRGISPEIPLQNNSSNTSLNTSITSDVVPLPDKLIASDSPSQTTNTDVSESGRRQQLTDSSDEDKQHVVRKRGKKIVQRGAMRIIGVSEDVLTSTFGSSRTVLYDCIGNTDVPRGSRKKTNSPVKRLSLITRGNRLKSRESPHHARKELGDDNLSLIHI